jgi:hypothetical protein
LDTGRDGWHRCGFERDGGAQRRPGLSRERSDRIADFGFGAREAFDADFSRRNFFAKKGGGELAEITQRRRLGPFELDHRKGPILGGDARRDDTDLDVVAALGDLDG